jgi:hypothetical protein
MFFQFLQDEGLVEVMFQQDGTLPTSREANESVLELCVSTEMEWYWEIRALATKFTCHASTLFSLGMYQLACRHVMSADIPESRQRIQMALKSVTTEMLTNVKETEYQLDICHASVNLSRGFYVIILFIKLKNTMNILMTKTCKLTVILILFILLLYAIF